MPLNISDTFLYAVNAGLVAGHRLIHKFGRNVAAGVSNEDIQYGGGKKTPLTTAVTMEAVSGSANDAIAGTHARRIRIWGTSAQFVEITEDIELAGLTPSAATSQVFLNVYRARILDTGTYNVANDGDITVRVSGAGSTELVMQAGTSVSQTSHYTVPLGHTGFLLRTGIEVDSAKAARILLIERCNTSLTSAPYAPHEHIHTWDGVKGAFSETFMANHRLPEKTDVWGESEAGATNTALEIDYDLLIIENRYVNV